MRWYVHHILIRSPGVENAHAPLFVRGIQCCYSCLCFMLFLVNCVVQYGDKILLLINFVRFTEILLSARGVLYLVKGLIALYLQAIH